MSEVSERVLIASWIEPHLVDQIRGVDPRINVVYEPDLLRPPRYAADHKGADRTRTPEQEAQWQDHLSQATILFDFDITHREDLPDLVPNVRWVQATSSGIGQLVRTHRYHERMPEAVFTTARGVHAQPLAEFALMAMLLHTREGLHTIRAQGEKAWARYAGTDLEGRELLIVGLGAIGARLAEVGAALGLKVRGIRRNPERGGPESLSGVHGIEELHGLLPQADFVVLSAPHTDETEGMIGAQELRLMPSHSALINVGRGALIRETELIEALEAGEIAGAYLDVFEIEPLPVESPLWTMPNVLVSPHSGSTSDRENGRIVALFCDNLRRFLAGEPLRNQLDTGRLY